MRRIGWLMLLLTAWLALGPSAALGQDATPAGVTFLLPQPRLVRAQDIGPDVPPADPVWPLPLYHDRPETGGVFAGIQFLMLMQTRPINHQLLAVRGVMNSTTGVFLGTGTPALWADTLGDEEFQPGLSFHLGYRFRSGLVVEAEWWHMFTGKYTGGATIASPFFNNGADFFSLFSPVYNFPLTFAGPDVDVVPPGAFNTAGIWNGAAEMTIEYIQRFDKFDITGRVPITQTDCCRTYGLVGARYAWLWDRFKWRTFDPGETVTGVIDEGPENVAIWTNIISNRMYGPFIGCGTEWYRGQGFALTAEVEAAILMDYTRMRAEWDRGDRFTLAKRNRRMIGLVPELEANVNVWWYPIEGVQLRVGYNILSFFNTVGMGDPVDFNFANVYPDWQREGIRLMHGLNVGVGIIF